MRSSIAIALFATCSTVYAESVAATSPLLQWTGRVSRDETAQEVSFDWEQIQCLFRVTGATSVSATLRSTFWATPPSADVDAIATSTSPLDAAIGGNAIGSTNTSAGGIERRHLQQSQFPKFGVYRVYVNGVRTETSGLDGVVVMHGESVYPLVSGLDPAQVYNIR